MKRGYRGCSHGMLTEKGNFCGNAGVLTAKQTATMIKNPSRSILVFGEQKMAKGRRLLAAGMALVLSVCTVGTSAAMSPLRCGERGHADCCCRAGMQQQTSDGHSCCQEKKAAARVCRCRQDQPQPTDVPTRNNSRPDRDWALKAADVAVVQIADLASGSRRCWSSLGLSYHSPPCWQSVACTWLF